IVDVEPVLKKGIFRQEIPIATTGHIKIQVPIAIGIEKHRIRILALFIGFEGWNVGGRKCSIAPLKKQLTGNSGWISYVDIFQSISVDIRTYHDGSVK